jgi:hypothetical protein
VGDKIRYKVKGRLPFTLTFDATVTQADPPQVLELQARGELEGVGRWTLSQHGTITTAQYTWDVRSNKRWMNLLAPLARPLFEWNHDGVMRDAGQVWLTSSVGGWSASRSVPGATPTAQCDSLACPRRA